MFVMGFGHLRRRGAGGEAPAVGGVTHPSRSPLDVLGPGSPGDAAPAPVDRGRVDQLALVEREPGPPGHLIRDGIHYLREADMAAGVDRIELGAPASMQWITGERAPHASGLRLLSWGVDSLYLSVYAQIAPGALAKLLDLHDLARKQGEADPVYVVLGGRQWMVTWAPAPYALRLEAPSIASIKIARRAGPHAPAVYIECRAQALAQFGVGALVDDLVMAVRSIEVPRREPTRVEVSRIDLAADFAGFDLDGTELPAKRWITSAQHRAMYFKAGRAGRLHDGEWDPSSNANKARRAAEKAREREQREADQVDAVYYRGRTYTGAAFGAGDVRCRHYLKTIEIKAKSGKGSWIKRLWTAGGWQKDEPVMRVEVQIRGQALKSMLGVSKTDTAVGRGRSSGVWAPGDITVGHDWRTVRRHLDALWRYMVGKPSGKGWITLRTPSAHAKPDRWPIDPRWEAIQAVEWGDVVDGYGLHGVELGRMRKHPTKKHVVGPRFRPDSDTEVTGTDVGRIVEQITGPDALTEWGDGLPKKAHAAKFGAILEDCFDADVEILSAEERREGLFASVNGMLASLGAALAIEEGRRPEPDHRQVLRWLEEAIDEEDFGQRWTKARQRFALRGVISYRAGRAHKRGDGRYLPNYTGAGTAA